MMRSWPVEYRADGLCVQRDTFPLFTPLAERQLATALVCQELDLKKYVFSFLLIICSPNKKMVAWRETSALSVTYYFYHHHSWTHLRAQLLSPSEVQTTQKGTFPKGFKFIYDSHTFPVCLKILLLFHHFNTGFIFCHEAGTFTVDTQRFMPQWHPVVNITCYQQVSQPSSQIQLVPEYTMA